MIVPDVLWKIPLKSTWEPCMLEHPKPGSPAQGKENGLFHYLLGLMKRTFLVSTLDRRFEFAGCSSDY